MGNLKETAFPRHLRADAHRRFGDCDNMHKICTISCQTKSHHKGQKAGTSTTSAMNLLPKNTASVRLKIKPLRRKRMERDYEF